MMRKLAIAMVASGAMGSAGMVNALGLGEITMHSTLNQPLNAEVELLNVRDLDAWEIQPALASGAEFDKAGVERFYFLTDLSFKVTVNEDGKAFVTIKSKKPVIEPFVNFLVEINWPSGRLLREYTLLLDPPVFSEEQPPVLETESSATVQPYAEAAEAKEAPVEVTAAVTGLQAEPGTYVVGDSDTLWEVAMRVRPGKQVSPQQTMLALQELNSSAFLHGNINLLKQHQVLRVPTLEQIQRRSHSAAVQTVAQQNKSFANKDYSKPVASAQIDARKRAPVEVVDADDQATGELKLLASGESDGVASGELDDDRYELENELALSLEKLDKNSRENEELQTRMLSLEEQLETLQRLIDLKDDQLAALQSGVTEELPVEPVAEEVSETEVVEGAAVEESEVAEEVAVESEALAEEAAPEELPEAEAEVVPGEVVSEGDVAAEDLNFQQQDTVEPEAVDAAPVIAPVPVPAPEVGLMGMVQQYMWQIAAGLSALILLLAGLALRKRKEPEMAADEEVSLEEFEEFEEGLGEFEEENLDELSLDEFDESLEDEEISVGDFASEEVLEDLEEEQTVAQTSDALSEADIYIAYGRFDQAVELLNNAVKAEPERSDLRLKLMEVFVETNDSQAFSEQEAQLAGAADPVLTQIMELKGRLSNPVDVADVTELEEVPELDDELLLDEEISFDLDDTELDLDLDASDDEVPTLDDFSGELEVDLDDADLGLSDDLTVLDVVETPEQEVETTDADLGLGDLELDSLEEDFALGDLVESTEDNMDMDFDSVLSEIEVQAGDDSDVVTGLSESDVSDELDSDLQGLLDQAIDGAGESEVADRGADDVPVLDDISLDLAEVELADVEVVGDDSVAAEVNELDSLSADLDDLDSLGAELDAMDADLGELGSLEAELDSLDTDFGEPDSLDAGLEELDSSGADQDSLDSNPDELESLDAELDVLETPNVDAELEDLSADLEGLDDLGDELEELDSLTVELDDLAADGSIEEQLTDIDGVEAELSDISIESGGVHEDVAGDIESLVDAVTESGPEQADDTFGDMDLSDLVDAEDEGFEFLSGTDEAETKLDLARAYIDMDDHEGAREILEEVVKDGSEKQQLDAKSLLDSL